MSDQPQVPTVTTTGIGRASTTPDTAVVTLAVQQVAPSPAAALAACSASMDAVLTAVRAYVPDPQDVQTSDLAVHPNYDHRSDRPQGYAARTSLIIRARRIEDAGAIATEALEAAGEAGQIQSLSLMVEDARQATDEARAAAFADARRRAEQLAALAGVALGEVLQVNELGGAGHQPHRFDSVAMLASSAAPPSIEPGQTQVVTAVTATWALLAP